jgi:hypothetical protein
MIDNYIFSARPSIVEGFFIGVLDLEEPLMNTSIFTAIVAGILLAGQNATPSWLNSYGEAKQQGAAQKKPLAVVFGSGANGWTKVVREAIPTSEVMQLLADKYVCVYIDTASPTGKKIAQDFGVTGNVGMVISDRAGSLQAFWHQGDLTNKSMVRYLERFSDPQWVVRSTEVVPSNEIVRSAEVVRPIKAVRPADVVQPIEVVQAIETATTSNAIPVWNTSYNQAQKIAAQKKPLAVVFGSGANGWTKVVREAAPASEVMQLLADKYICVYVDTASAMGKKSAQDFGVTGSVGLAISDRAGSLQAFWHQGDLTNQNMAYFLQKYSDPQFVVRSTGTATSTRTSFYPPLESSGNYDDGASQFLPGYCPSCNNARGRR